MIEGRGFGVPLSEEMRFTVTSHNIFIPHYILYLLKSIVKHNFKASYKLNQINE